MPESQKCGKMAPVETEAMNFRVDLHLHTTASDGRWTPNQLVEEVHRAGIGLFSVTDHDSLGGLAKTIECVQGRGLCFLPGVELSARLNGQLYHLLGYGFDPTDPHLASFVETNNARLHRGSDEAVRLLAEAGYPISLDDYAIYTWDRQRGGWKALNFLIDQGLCRDVHNYFSELFGNGLDHPEPDYPSPEEAITAIQQADGVVVLAHPGASFCDGTDAGRLDELVEMGLAGIECYSFQHDVTATRFYLEYCRRRDLLVTGGSDCHGGFAGRALGVPAVYSGDLRLDGLSERVVT